MSFRRSRSGPIGLPRENRNVENTWRTQIFNNSFTLDKQTYAAICKVIDTLLDACCRSTNAASRVAPWI
eukprot:3219045-Pyramimonas_sp.AAC.1